MAYIGMRKPIIAKITERVDGSAITYDTPIVVGPAVSANVTYSIADNPDMGDDVIVDNDKGINGYNITLETNDVCIEAKIAALNYQALVDAENNNAVTGYRITDAEPNEVGFGYIRVKMFRGVRSYEAFFYHALRFSSGGDNASTKQQQIQWNHPTLNGTGIGCYLDSDGEAAWFDYMEFETEGDAEEWIYGKFGAEVPTAEESATPAAGGGSSGGSTPPAAGGGSSGGT